MTKNNLIDQMRPQGMHQDILTLRKKSGEQFYHDHSNDLVEVECPACGEDGEVVFSKYFFQHKKCAKCHTLYCSPRPPENLLFKYYREYEAPNTWTEILLSTNSIRKAQQYQPRIKLLIETLKDNYKEPLKVAYDIGAGSGAFTLALRDAGYFEDVIAVDITDSCVEACQKLGLKTLNSAIQDIPDATADYLAINDLFEHLYSPKDFLIECRRVLTNDGVLSIAAPNGEGFDFQIFKEDTINITPPEHLNYFNPTSIELLLKRNGFEVLYLETPGKLDVDIVCREVEKNQYNLKDKYGYLHYLFMEHSDKNHIKTQFQEFLQNNRLSSHLLVIAKKI